MRKFPIIEIDQFVVMPNHFHGILVIVNDEPARHDSGALIGSGAHPDIRPGADMGKGAHTCAPLPTIMQWFKTMTTNEYIRGVKAFGWAPFDRKLWQRNYYEHIIRDEEELRSARLYIENNPAQWALDRENSSQAHK